MAVPVFPFLVTRGDLGVDHQHALGRAIAHGIDGLLQAEGGGRARHVHVKGITARANGVLNLDGDGGVGALQVGAGANHAVHIGTGLAGCSQRLLGSFDTDLGQHGELVIAALLEARVHALGVEDAGLLHDVTALDAGRLFDELDAGMGQRLNGARFDLGRMFRVEEIDVSIERRHQFGVRDGVRRRVEAGSADDNCAHGNQGQMERRDFATDPVQRGAWRQAQNNPSSAMG